MVAPLVVIGASFSDDVWSQIGRLTARDPGVRSGLAGAGGMLSGLTAFQQQVFENGREDFEEVQSVQRHDSRDGASVSGRASTWTVAPAVTRIQI